MHECFNFAVQLHSHNRMVGTRKVLSKCMEEQPNGKGLFCFIYIIFLIFTWNWINFSSSFSIWKMGNGRIWMEELQSSGRNGQWLWKGFARIRLVSLFSKIIFTFEFNILKHLNNYRFESYGTNLYFCWNQSWLVGLCLRMFQANISIGYIVCQSWWRCYCTWSQWNGSKFFFVKIISKIYFLEIDFRTLIE